jgi:hypothetical protein
MRNSGEFFLLPGELQQSTPVRARAICAKAARHDIMNHWTHTAPRLVLDDPVAR